MFANGDLRTSGRYRPRCPHEGAPLIHQARGSSLIEERATVMWNMITHEQIIRVITIALAGQQPARRLQGIWFYLWTHGSWCVRAGCSFASLMLVDRFGSRNPWDWGEGEGEVALGGIWVVFERLNFRGKPWIGDLWKTSRIGEWGGKVRGWIRSDGYLVWNQGWVLTSYLTLGILWYTIEFFFFLGVIIYSVLRVNNRVIHWGIRLIKRDNLPYNFLDFWF